MRVVWLLPSLFACIGPGTSLPPEDRATPERLLELPGYSEGVAFDAHGTAFFSVGRNPEDQHAVYQLRPGLQPTMWLSLRIPNGHKVLRDGTHVVAGDGVILHVAPDGGLLDSLTSDGFGRPLRRPNDIALDANGRLYVAHNGLGRIEVLDTLGHILRRYAAGQTLASNVAFGGRGLEDLFITGSPVPKSGPGGLYRLHLGIRGRSSMAVPAPPCPSPQATGVRAPTQRFELTPPGRHAPGAPEGAPNP